MHATRITIYRYIKSSTQSGTKKTAGWTVGYVGNKTNIRNPICGWTKSIDTVDGLTIKFVTLESAINYAKSNNLSYRVVNSCDKTYQAKNYADNFTNKRLLK